MCTVVCIVYSVYCIAYGRVCVYCVLRIAYCVVCVAVSVPCAVCPGRRCCIYVVYSSVGPGTWQYCAGVDVRGVYCACAFSVGVCFYTLVPVFPVLAIPETI